MKNIIAVIICLFLVCSLVTVNCFADTEYKDYGWYTSAVRIIPEPVVDENDVKLIAAMIRCEALGQPYAGKQAVAIVIVNRLESDRFRGDTIEAILRAEGQFDPCGSGWWDSVLRWGMDEVSEECFDAARYALEGNKTVTYNNVEYDLSDYYFFMTQNPGCRVQIGDHQFS